MTGTSRVEHSSESKGIPKCWKMLVSILPYGRGSTIHTGYTVHVVENERHIINKVSCHESVYSCKNSLIGGLFGVILGVKGAHKHKMEQSWIGEQNIVQWGFVLVFVLDEFVRIGKPSKAEIFGLFSSQATGVVSMNLRLEMDLRTERLRVIWTPFILLTTIMPLGVDLVSKLA